MHPHNAIIIFLVKWLQFEIYVSYFHLSQLYFNGFFLKNCIKLDMITLKIPKRLKIEKIEIMSFSQGMFPVIIVNSDRRSNVFLSKKSSYKSLKEYMLSKNRVNNRKQRGPLTKGKDATFFWDQCMRRRVCVPAYNVDFGNEKN